MTHAQALAGHPLPVETADCPGRLELLDAALDRQHGRQGPSDRVVAVYQCERCGRRLSLARAVLDGERVAIAYEVLNDYWPSPRELVAGLARALGAAPLKRS